MLAQSKGMLTLNIRAKTPNISLKTPNIFTKYPSILIKRLIKEKKKKYKFVYNSFFIKF